MKHTNTLPSATHIVRLEGTADAARHQQVKNAINQIRRSDITSGCCLRCHSRGCRTPHVPTRSSMPKPSAKSTEAHKAPGRSRSVPEIRRERPMPASQQSAHKRIPTNPFNGVIIPRGPFRNCSVKGYRTRLMKGNPRFTKTNQISVIGPGWWPSWGMPGKYRARAKTILRIQNIVRLVIRRDVPEPYWETTATTKEPN